MRGSTRRPNRLAARAVTCALLAAIGGACASGGDDTAPTRDDAVRATLDVPTGPVTVASAGPPDVALPDAVRDQIVGSIREYVDLATVAPLRTGRPAGKLDPLFTASAAARIAGPDRAVVVDDGLPRAEAKVVARAQPVALTALADQHGAVILVSADLALSVATESEDGPVKIARVGELLFAPEAGAWRMSGFDLAVHRSGAGLGDEGQPERGSRDRKAAP
jgi:hypothetical protein